MQWNQIKTLFIICFLVLDVYLLYQYFNKQKEDDLSVQDRPDSTIEEQLARENIKVGDLPDQEYKESFIRVRQHALSESESKQLKDLPNQQSIAIDGKFILSIFDKPIALPKGVKNDEIDNIIGNNIIHPDEYEFWTWDKKLNVLVFFQKKMDRPVYFNQNGMILVFLNDKNEITSYTQTMLAKPDDTNNEAEKLIKPVKAVETLYKSNQLSSGSEIKRADLVFYTRVPLRNGVQVFVPTWKLAVNDKDGSKNFFVNAIEGYVIQSDETLFMKNTIEEDIDRIEKTEFDGKLKERLLQTLKERLELINRGEKS
ncbi:two-component system regulatory protein YycI [Aciduricibacillus chroicocephali]|uniref:Two-component system regulatory protein YycI n=1 Tax=Aciduricibacillus chroicocephali TaxID=3054939 RepID=A0ABY9KV39_9BACI|nr:two-component system regulatory protein YycI [Bacillaceae bacterium 44XB]